ncbi:MAG: sulfatase [Myxococcota bacterium]|nr:sulfatase [Myxococcota bacterium]
MVVIDTLRADHLSSYGYPRLTSPRLDAFAAENLRFADARSQAACTSPSMSSLLTSRSPVTLLDQPRGHIGIPEGMPSLPELLKKNDYWTIAISASPIVRDSPSEANRFGEFGRGFDVFHEECLMEDAACVNRAAIESLDIVTEPFFLYVHYMDVHGPYDPPADFDRPFSKTVHQPQFLREGRSEQIQRRSQNFGTPILPEHIAHLRDLYDDEIAYLDKQLGIFLDSLEDRGLLEDSLVVIASDHGEAFGERGYLGHCRLPLFEAMISTPLVMQLPGIDESRVLEGTAQNLDIVPTVLDYLGLDFEEVHLEGRSLRPLIEKQRPVNPYVFAIQGVEVAASDPRFTLTFRIQEDEGRLFDRRRDPDHGEELSEEHEADRSRLRKEAEAWLGTTDDLAEDARRLEDELRALGYLQSPADTRPAARDSTP